MGWETSANPRRVLGPVLAARVGMAAVYHGVAVLLVAWAVAFALLARNAPAPATAQRKGLGAMIEVLTRERLSWLLSAFYFLTFGGFVAFSIYLPTLAEGRISSGSRRRRFPDRRLRGAGDAAAAAGRLALRPHRRRARAVRCVPRSGAVRHAAGVALDDSVHGRRARLRGVAGLGNGAVFKLVPQYFPGPDRNGYGTGGRHGRARRLLPAAAAGILPQPDRRHLAGLPTARRHRAGACGGPTTRSSCRDSRRSTSRCPPICGAPPTALRAGAWATLWTALLIAAIVVGSRNLQNFDPALVIYTFAVVFATWGVVYHYNVWLEKPPTRVYWDRGWELYRRRGIFRSLFRVALLAVTHLAAQRFIAHRSRLRWWMHQCLFWGCLLAVAITFPLVFGWIHFRTLPGDQLTYVTYLFGFPDGRISPRTPSRPGCCFTAWTSRRCWCWRASRSRCGAA